MRGIFWVFGLTLLLAGGLAEPAAAQELDDRHIGYYYPHPQTYETFVSRGRPLPQASRQMRVGFVVGYTTSQLELPYPPEFVLYAKGAEAQKLIIASLDDDRMNTLYRARAVLAMMTAVARTMPIFVENGVEDSFTFFDLAKLLGFEQITVTDGRDFAHQVTLD
ncbi:molybdopterin-guanine dinucleotide biosynthesis protein A [Algihabitans albus]|uniref:molybdopterin-guanine dinucleotide biosynthesis protein A n=1 Tax=Algihabitans albus TaxID=2164067 RepID=UPI000E5CE4EB|nr:molybdopterin-guanine dinucleotide biosynthesis protein A [Algihabitans albus]